MPATIATKKADLETRCANVADLTVFDHEPAAGDGLRGKWMSIATVAITPDFWRVAVRIYVDTSVGAKVAQDTLDELVPQVEAELLAGGYGPLDWTFDVLPDAQYAATCILDIGREDYY